jgi:TonB family protein
MTTHSLLLSRVRATVFTSVLVCIAPPTASAQDTLDAAKALYASAAYEEALAVLGRLKPAEPADAAQVDRYRAFCLIALGRNADAEQVIASMIAADPHLKVTEADASPRVMNVFNTARTKLLPDITRQRFAAAKTAYSEKKYAEARKGFSRVLELLKSPELPDASNAAFADMRTVSEGFLELAIAAEQKETLALAAASTLPMSTNGHGTAPVVAASSSSAPASAAPTRAAVSTVIVPPQVINQRVPRPTNVNFAHATRRVLLDITISELGRVEDAKIIESTNEIYNAMLLSATKDWRYKPATRGGRPVKFSKRLEIKIQQ